MLFISAPLRCLIAIYVIVVATENIIKVKQRGIKLGGRVGPGGAYCAFVGVAVGLILQVCSEYFGICENMFARTTEYSNSVFSIIVLMAVTHKNWYSEKLTLFDYIKYLLCLIGVACLYCRDYFVAMVM